MSIFIIRGPQASGTRVRTADPLPGAVLRSLVHRAIDAGRTVAIRSCSCEDELLTVLRVADHTRGEITLLDPGCCAGSPRVQQRLRAMRNAWIEVHGETGATVFPADCGRRIGLADGYLAQTWVLALDMALEHLGDAEACNPLRVGT
mgnify:FL=1